MEKTVTERVSEIENMDWTEWRLEKMHTSPVDMDIRRLGLTFKKKYPILGDSVPHRTVWFDNCTGFEIKGLCSPDNFTIKKLSHQDDGFTSLCEKKAIPNQGHTSQASIHNNIANQCSQTNIESQEGALIRIAFEDISCENYYVRKRKEISVI